MDFYESCWEKYKNGVNIIGWAGNITSFYCLIGDEIVIIMGYLQKIMIFMKDVCLFLIF